MCSNQLVDRTNLKPYKYGMMNAATKPTSQQLNPTHWVVVRENQFSGTRSIVERRNKRKAAAAVRKSLEQFTSWDNEIFWLLRSDEPIYSRTGD